MDTTMDAREERGRQIATAAQIKRVGRRWAVPSQSRASERYLVDIEESACTCPDAELHGPSKPCKHQHAVLFWIAWGRDVGEDGCVTETITLKRKTYAQPCWRTYNASQVHERAYVERLLAALCAGLVQPPYTPGRGSKPLPIADLAFAVVMKTFMAMSNRRVQSDLRDSAARGNVRTVGHFNSISKFLAEPSSTEILTSLIEQSAAPLCAIENGQYAIDSTGFSTVTYDRWFDEKHGKLNARHQWVKLHIACGTVTHAITAARVTSEGDCPQLPALLADTMKHHTVREFSADKAYSSVENHNVMDSLGVEAFIPFKVNAVVNPKAPVWSRHLVEFTLNQEHFLAHYHRRSNVETVFAMLKARFGASVASRLPTARANEVLAMCVAHNLCCLVKAIFTAGLAPAFWQDAPAALPSPLLEEQA
jgi:transposase